LVQVWDQGMDGERPYLVMEFIDGENLGRRIAREGPLPEAEAVHIILQVGEGLHSAHQRQMIHRDVKPDNILLCKEGQAKLTDLGPPGRLVPSLSARLDEAVCKALDASPENRHSSCREFMDCLSPLAPRAPAPAPSGGPAAAAAAPAAPPPGDDERESLRYPADLQATCKALHGGPDGWKAEVQDVSWTGMRLTLGRRFEPGAVLSIDLL